MRTFHGLLRNLGPSPADFALRISTPFGDWPTDFIVSGDAVPHTLPLEMEIPSGGSCDVYVRGSTDMTRGIRSGAFEVTCLSTGASRTNTFRLFNGGPALLLVDNDGGSNYELPMVHALDANGYLYERWDAIVRMGTPSLSRMRGYDVVLWESAGRVPDVLTEGDMAGLMAFMDGGGSLFLTTNYYLNSLDYVNNAFTRDYLGVDDWTLDRGYLQMGGVAGDAIGDGIDLALDFRFPAWAVGGDDAEPVPGAMTDFLAEDGSHAMIRNLTASNARSVFMPQRFDAVSETDPDPNNAKTLIHRVVEWLRPEGSAGADDRAAPPSASGIERVSPNPFRARAEIRFSLSVSEARAPVRLEVFDLGGRRVATILDGILSPGAHILSWDGRIGGGAEASSGVYLARLSTRGGTRGARLIRIR
jgi:hypothetical protein